MQYETKTHKIHTYYQKYCDYVKRILAQYNAALHAYWPTAHYALHLTYPRTTVILYKVHYSTWASTTHTDTHDTTRTKQLQRDNTIHVYYNANIMEYSPSIAVFP